MAAKKKQDVSAPKPTIEPADAEVEARLAELEAEAKATAAASAEAVPAAEETAIPDPVIADEPAGEPAAPAEPFQPSVTPTVASSNAESRDPREAGAAARKSLGEAASKVRNLFDGVAPGHSNTIIFAIVGLIAAILLFQVGFWRMLVLVVFIVIGIAIGESLDGDPRLINMFKGFFDRK